MSQPASDYRLDDDKVREVFEQDIVPDLLSRGRTSSEPIVVFVVGQPGAGKSRAQTMLLAELGREHAVVVDADDMRPYHPQYDDLARADDLTAAALCQREASQWVDMAIEHLTERRIDTVVSATFGDPETAEQRIDQFRKAGYRVEVAAVAVDDVQSRLGVLARYQGQRDEIGIGRYVPPQIQSSAYTGVLATLDHIDHNQLADAVYVYNRNGQQLYSNRATSNGWEQPAGTRAAVDTERARPWTQHEINNVMDTATELGTTLRPELHGELAAAVTDARKRLDAQLSGSAVSHADAARRAAQAWSIPTQQAAPMPSAPKASARRAEGDRPGLGQAR